MLIHDENRKISYTISIRIDRLSSQAAKEPLSNIIRKLIVSI